MTMTVGEMTLSELREMIDFIIEQKLREMLGDPDEGLELREAVVVRLRKQQQDAVTTGERGTSPDQLKSEFSLD